MGGCAGRKGTTVPCDVSDLCVDQVIGQRLRPILTTFIQIFVYSCVLTCHINIKRLGILYSLAHLVQVEQYFELCLVILLFWHENATMSFLLSLSSMAACSAEPEPHACFCFKST